MRRDGFTLIELIAALALTGLAIGGAWGLLQQVADHRDRVTAGSVGESRVANGLRLARSLVFSASAGNTPGERFSGTADMARFLTWCDAPGGWRARCTITLAAGAAGDSSEVTAVTQGRAPVTLLRARDRLSFRYAELGADGLVWRSTWIDGITPPAALAMIAGADTIIFPVGAGL